MVKSVPFQLESCRAVTWTKSVRSVVMDDIGREFSMTSIYVNIAYISSNVNTACASNDISLVERCGIKCHLISLFTTVFFYCLTG